jgi:hypothetical protein
MLSSANGAAVGTMPPNAGSQMKRHYVLNLENGGTFTETKKFTLHAAADIWAFTVPDVNSDILAPVTAGTVTPGSGDDAVVFGGTVSGNAFEPNDVVNLGNTGGVLYGNMATDKKYYVRTVSTTPEIMLHNAPLEQITTYSAASNTIDASNFNDNDVIRFSLPGSGGAIPAANPAIVTTADYYVRKTGTGDFSIHVKNLIEVSVGNQNANDILTYDRNQQTTGA